MWLASSWLRTKDWFLDMVEPWRLDTEVVRDMASSLLPP